MSLTPIHPLRPAQQAAEPGGAVHRDLYRWLTAMATAANLWLVPPKGIILANLSSADVSNTANFDATGLGNPAGTYAGWAICNGSNGTPSLDGRFPRLEVSGAGTTGGSDSSAHTHAVDPSSFMSGAGGSHTHDAGTLRADVGIENNEIYQNRAAGGYTATRVFTATGNLGAASSAATATDTVIHGATAAESAHTHAIDVPSTTSGAASVTDNRPAYFELVPLMRVG